MFAVSSVNYKVPEYFGPEETGGVEEWGLEERRSTVRMFLTDAFNYTFILSNEEKNVKERMTFTFHQKSVKPTGRTLRVYGQQVTSRIAKIMSRGYVSGMAEESINRALANIGFKIKTEK
jgi:hypothetical protein